MSLISEAQKYGKKCNSNEKLNYDLVKKRFIAGILYGNKIERPFTTKQLNKLISNIKFKKVKSAKYEVLNHHQKDRLILKSHHPKSQIIEILSLSELFDVLAEVHLALYHFNIENEFAVLKRRYYVKMEWIQLLRNACNVCTTLKYTEIPKNLTRFNKHVVQLNIISQTLYQNRRLHKGLIIYKDYVTNYVLLRQIYMKKDIAYELFKIFMDFGIPDCVEVSNKNIFKNIFNDTIQTLLPNCQLNIVEKKLTKSLQVQRYIYEAFDLWNLYNGDYSVFKLIELQWKLNLKVKPVGIRSKIVTEHTRETPYFALFNRNVKVNISPAPYREKFTPRVEMTCGYCNRPMFKSYVCYYCKNLVHFFCCKRKFFSCMQNDMIVTCFKCDELLKN